MVSKPKGKQTQIAGYYDPEAVKQLRALSKITHVPQAVYLRQALDALLKTHSATLRKAKN
jgi:Ribbon-helix-helix domain